MSVSDHIKSLVTGALHHARDIATKARDIGKFGLSQLSLPHVIENLHKIPHIGRALEQSWPVRLYKTSRSAMGYPYRFQDSDPIYTKRSEIGTHAYQPLDARLKAAERHIAYPDNLTEDQYHNYLLKDVPGVKV